MNITSHIRECRRGRDGVRKVKRIARKDSRATGKGKKIMEAKPK